MLTKVKVFICIIQLLNCYNYLSATDSDNTIDSLQALLNSTNDDASKINIFIELSIQHSILGEKEECLKYIQNAKILAENLKNIDINIEILLSEGKNFYILHEYELALKCFYKALKICPKTNKTTIATIYYRIGMTYVEMLQSSKADNYLNKALVIAKDCKKDTLIARIYKVLGVNYYYQYQHNKSIEYLVKAENLFRMLNDKPNLVECYMFFGAIYSLLDKDHKSIYYYKKALELVEKSDQQAIALLRLNLFSAYFNLKEYKTAFDYADNNTISVLEKYKDYDNLCIFYTNYCYHCLDTGNIVKVNELKEKLNYFLSKSTNQDVINHAELMLGTYYCAINNPDSALIILNKYLARNDNKEIVEKNIKLFYKSLSGAFERKGNFKSAIDFYKKYMLITDSISKISNESKILEIQTQYEIDLKNKQIEFIKKEKQATQQKIVIFALCFIILLIIGLIFLIYKQQKSREKQLIYKAKLKETADALDFKNRELTNNAMHLSRQEQILSGLKEQLLNISAENHNIKEALSGILSNIDLHLKQNVMDDFEKYFIEVHPEFFNHLRQKYPELTSTEHKVCAFLRLNLTSKEIANITHKSIRSIENSRTNIRRKMRLNKENLYDYLSTI